MIADAGLIFRAIRLLFCTSGRPVRFFSAHEAALHRSPQASSSVAVCLNDSPVGENSRLRLAGRAVPSKQHTNRPSSQQTTFFYFIAGFLRVQFQIRAVPS